MTDAESIYEQAVAEEEAGHYTAAAKLYEQYEDALDAMRDERAGSELARWAESNVPPPGFDPADAGERWDEDE